MIDVNQDPEEIDISNSDSLQRILDAWASGMRPESRLDATEWAERNIVLTTVDSAEPGELSFDRTPFLREILDNLSTRSPIQKVTLLKGRQLGATLLGSCFLGYVIDHVPGPMLYATASLDLARKTSKQRIRKLIDSCDALRSKVVDRRSSDGSNTLLEKQYPGGFLNIIGSNSASSLRSMPARFGFADEVDGWPQDVEGEGCPLFIFEGRFDTYRRIKKILIASTPTLEASSRIKTSYLQGDQREYLVPCPKCGSFQPIRFSWLRGPKGESFKSLEPPEEVFLLCDTCEYLIPEYAKEEILPAGYWNPTAEAEDKFHRSYRLPSWYSPLGWYSWKQGVDMFLRAKREGKESILKVFTNQIDADTWKEKEIKIDELLLFNRREKYAAEVPAGALLLTAGVDVQEDRFEVTVWGWGIGFESWAIETRVFWLVDGKNAAEYPGPFWNQLDDFLSKTWRHESGQDLYCAAVGIDTGGRYTQETYEYVKDRESRSIFAMKGRGGPGVPDVLAPTRKRTGDNNIPVELFTIGSNAMKDKLFSRLGMRSAGPGYCHFPDSEDFDQEFFASLTGEKKLTKRKKGFVFYEWHRFRRNDVLDCYQYSYAAALILSPVWEALTELLSVDVADSEEQSPEVQRAPQVRRRNWATDWNR